MTFSTGNIRMTGQLRMFADRCEHGNRPTRVQWLRIIHNMAAPFFPSTFYIADAYRHARNNWNVPKANSRCKFNTKIMMGSISSVAASLLAHVLFVYTRPQGTRRHVNTFWQITWCWWLLLLLLAHCDIRTVRPVNLWRYSECGLLLFSIR